MPVLRVNPRGFFGSRVLRVLAFCLRGVVGLLRRTCRFEVISGAEHLERRGPKILVFWHNRAILGACFLHGFKHTLDLAVLASPSQDGELVAHAARQWKLEVVRGSAGKGGRAALRALHRTLVDGEATPILVPDGPLGPLYEFKLGVAVLAQMARAEIVPLGLAANRFRALGSWDRLMVPKLFARVTVVVGAPQTVPRGLDAQALEAERRRLEEALTAVTTAAERAADG